MKTIDYYTPVVKISSQLNTQLATTIDEEIEAELFVLRHDKKVDGKAYIKDGVFYVKKGSVGKKEQASSQHNFIINQRQSLIDKSLVRVIDDKIEFTQDVAFTSTSTPAAMLFGRPTSGPSTWKVLGQPQTSYKDWEEMQLL